MLTRKAIDAAATAGRRGHPHRRRRRRELAAAGHGRGARRRARASGCGCRARGCAPTTARWSPRSAPSWSPAGRAPSAPRPAGRLLPADHHRRRLTRVVASAGVADLRAGVRRRSTASRLREPCGCGQPCCRSARRRTARPVTPSAEASQSRLARTQLRRARSDGARHSGTTHGSPSGRVSRGRPRAGPAAAVWSAGGLARRCRREADRSDAGMPSASCLPSCQQVPASSQVVSTIAAGGPRRSLRPPRSRPRSRPLRASSTTTDRGRRRRRPARRPRSATRPGRTRSRRTRRRSRRS